MPAASTPSSSRRDFVASLLPRSSARAAAPAATLHEREAHDTMLHGGRVAAHLVWPRFTLVNHRGAEVDFHRDVIAERAVVIAFFYTRCRGSCPATLGRMLELEHRLRTRPGVPARFVSITLEPEADSAATLATYAKENLPTGSDWHLLTGEKSTLTALRRQLGFYDLDPAVDGDPRRHAAMVLLGDDRTHRWISLPSIASPRQWLSALTRCAA